MNATELLKRILATNVDDTGISDRFDGDAELYDTCFRYFLDEPNLMLLDEAISIKDYEKAFAAAHTLKGLSGNLGLTAFYDAIGELVESLRTKSYGKVENEYAAAMHELHKLRGIISDEPFMTEPSADWAIKPTSLIAAKTPSKPHGKTDWFLPVSAMIILVILMGVGLLFFGIFVEYNENITHESATHLVEINHQMKLYIEEKIENDWNVARSVGDSITGSNYTDDDAAVFDMLLRKRDVWKVTELMLYTENGYAIRSDGGVEANDLASEAINMAREQNGFVSIIDSDLIYTVPVETNLTFNGSRIVAVSVFQNMGSFLDNMNFSSFDGSAWMYLTSDDGIVISKLTNNAAEPVFNFIALVEGKKLKSLDKRDLFATDLLSATTPTALLMLDEGGTEYVVSTPISAHGAPLRLFYLVPEAVVNETMNGFSAQLIRLSLFVILVFAVAAILFFRYVYLVRKKQFDERLLAREHMFDLLVHNTRTAFGLFTTSQDTPVYISGNAVDVIGDEYWTIEKSPSGYRMQSSADPEPDVIRQVNERMRDWDGRSVFKSGYVFNGSASTPSYFELQLYPVDSENGSFVGIAQDMTQVYEREEAAKAAMEMAKRSNEAKSRFLSNMSHDIRTPMNAIVNMTAFARKSKNDPEKLDAYLQTLQESSDHLLGIINEVLDMSRIESGQIVIGSEPFDIKAEIERLAAIIRPLCQARNQKFITNFESIKTTAVRGDQVKFSQIIMNLLSNAVKFTPEKGVIHFTAEEIPSLREDVADIRFTIEDNGIGISKEYLQHIFEPFSRADEKRVSNVEGTGLGLSICRGYVLAMGGIIHCESEEGNGSVFTVELFFSRSDAVPETDDGFDVPEELPFRGKCCLVLEDNAINLAIANTLLTQLGFSVELASDGQRGIERFLASESGHYDIIYTDIQMPVMDGYQAAAAIRKSDHAQAGTIPIVAVSANVFAEDVDKARVAEMDAFLGKPITTRQLIEETNKAFMNRKRNQRK